MLAAQTGMDLLLCAARDPGEGQTVTSALASALDSGQLNPAFFSAAVQRVLLYGELIRYEPTPVVEANRAVAVAMAEGPAAGLVILDALACHPQLQRWPQLYIARAELLRRLGRGDEAAEVYRAALDLEPAASHPVVHQQAAERRLGGGAPGRGHAEQDGYRGRLGPAGPGDAAAASQASPARVRRTDSGAESDSR